jgi:hypothetical protein
MPDAIPTPDTSQFAPTSNMTTGAVPTPAPDSLAPAPEGAQAPQEAAPEEPKQEDQNPELRRAWANLSRRERAIVRREAEFKAAQAQMEAQARETEAIRSLLAKAKEEGPLALLEIGDQLGIPFEGVIDALTQYGKEPTPEEKLADIQRRLDEKEAAERKAREDWEARQKEEEERRALAQVDQKVEAYKTRLAQQVASNLDQYELLSLHEDPGSLLWDVQLQYFQMHGEHLSDAELLNQTESVLEEREAARVSRSKKLQRALGSTQAAAPVESSPSMTLANRATSQAPVLDPNWPSDEDESKKKAANLLRWL